MMNWDEIQKLTTDEKDLFDLENPSDTHMERFNLKLKKRFQSNQKMFWRIAASIAMVLIISGTFLIIYFSFRINQVHNTIASSTTIELNETELYYKQQVIKELDQLNHIKFPDPKQKTTVLKELAAMDQNYKQLKKELDKNPDDERLINGIVEHYQVKLDAISHIINSVTYCQTNSKINSHDQNI